MTRGLNRRRLRNALVLLVVAALSLTCTALLEYRIRHTGSERYAFMTWNLVLAWLPLVSATLADELARLRPLALRALSLPLAFVWLLFLPNAPYLATDLIHLREAPYISWWFDASMMLGYAATGVLLGLTSLLFMQDAVAVHAGRAASWLFALAALVLSSFGVYLGRFERFNSWEMVSSPSLVIEEAWLHVRDPFEYSHAYEFTIVIALMLAVAYLALFGVAEGGVRVLGMRSKR